MIRLRRLPAMEANLTSLLQTYDAVNLRRGDQVTELAIAEAALRTLEVPAGFLGLCHCENP